VRERRLVIADAVDDREMAVLVEPLHAGHVRLEAEMIVELAQLVGPDADLRTRPVIGVVAIGHHGVEPVIAAGELDDDQDAAGLRRGRRTGL
jgi:hypothetical protein